MGVVLGPDSNREEQLNRMIEQYEKDLLRMCCVYLRDASLAEGFHCRRNQKDVRFVTRCASF